MSFKEHLWKHRRGLFVSLASVAALSLTTAATMGGFSATIVNPNNTFASGTLQLEESLGSATCYSAGGASPRTVSAANSFTCTTINKLGDALKQVPGGTPVSTTVTLTNVGNLAATTDTLVAGTCAASASSDNLGFTGADVGGFCGKVDVTVDNTTSGATDKCLYPVVSTTTACNITASGNTGNLASLSGTSVPGLDVLGVGQSATYKFTVMLDPSATNADQGLSANIPLTWAQT
ncbi:MAG: hypothetical protein ACYCVN_14875 [Acidimicrobiales bacterium]